MSLQIKDRYVINEHIAFSHAELQKLLGEPTNIHSGWSLSGPIHTTNRSIIYRAKNNNYPKNLCLKFSGKNIFPEPKLITEFAKLNYYNDKFTNSQMLKTTSALTFSTELNCLVSEWETAPSLLQFLNQWWRLIFPRTLQKERLNRFYRVGQSLHEFHSAGGMSIEKFNSSEIVDNLKTRLSKVDASDNRLSENVTFQKSADLLVAMAPMLNAQEITFSNLHGDLSPRNILVDQEKVTYIDISRKSRGACITDLVQFFLEIQMTNHFRQQNNKHIFDILDIAAFIKGYGIDLNQQNCTQILYLYLHQTLKNWISFSNKMYKSKNGIGAFPKAQYFWFTYRFYQMEKIAQSLNQNLIISPNHSQNSET